MKILVALIAASVATVVTAKLPPPTDDAKAKAAEVAAKSAWDDKVSLFKLCMAMDRTVDAYRKGLKQTGAAIPVSQANAPCVDPGPFVYPLAVTPLTSKPLEAAGAHSPPGTATSPPNTKVPAAELSKGNRKDG